MTLESSSPNEVRATCRRSWISSAIEIIEDTNEHIRENPEDSWYDIMEELLDVYLDHPGWCARIANEVLNADEFRWATEDLAQSAGVENVQELFFMIARAATRTRIEDELAARSRENSER